MLEIGPKKRGTSLSQRRMREGTLQRKLEKSRSGEEHPRAKRAKSSVGGSDSNATSSNEGDELKDLK